MAMNSLNMVEVRLPQRSRIHLQDDELALDYLAKKFSGAHDRMGGVRRGHNGSAHGQRRRGCSRRKRPRDLRATMVAMAVNLHGLVRAVWGKEEGETVHVGPHVRLSTSARHF